MSTGYGLQGNLRILGQLQIARPAKRRPFGLTVGVVAVEANPVHLTATKHLILADDRNVVLGLTGHDTGVAADAGVEVDRHTPLVVAVEFRRLVERATARQRLRAFLTQLDALFAGEFLLVDRSVLGPVDRGGV